MGRNYLSIPKLQRCNRWSLGMDKQFHPALFWACNYLSMLGLKLNHVSKRGHWSKWTFGATQDCGIFEARTILSSHQLLIIPTSNLNSNVMKYKWLEHFIVDTKLRVRNGLFVCLSIWSRCWFNFDLIDIKNILINFEKFGLKYQYSEIMPLGSCGQCSANL